MRTCNRRVLSFGVILCLSLSHSAMALSPPWNTLWSKINATVGTTPGVKVSPLMQKNGGAVYVVPIQAPTAQAVAIASILPPTYKLGNITVEVAVTDEAGKPVIPSVPSSADQLAEQIRIALKGNPAFMEVVLKTLPFSRRVSVFPVFTRSVVQFFNDDLSDLYSNFNGVTADVYKDVLATPTGDFQLAPSTAP